MAVKLFPLLEVKSVNTQYGGRVLAIFEGEEEAQIQVWIPDNKPEAKEALTFEVGTSYPVELIGTSWRLAKESKSSSPSATKRSTGSSNNKKTLPPLNEFIEGRLSLYLIIYQQITKQLAKQGLSLSDKMIESLAVKTLEQAIDFYGDIPNSMSGGKEPNQDQRKDHLLSQIKSREIDTSTERLMGLFEKKLLSELTTPELEELVQFTYFDAGSEVILDDVLVNKISAKIYKGTENEGKTIQSSGVVEKIKDDGNTLDLIIKDNFEPYASQIVSVRSLGRLCSRQF